MIKYAGYGALLFALIVAFAALPRQAASQSGATATVAGLGAPITLLPHMVGFNNQLAAVANPWSVETRRVALTAARTGVLRYPGGTVATYWDMNAGMLFTNGETINIPGGILTQTKYTIGWVSTFGKQPNTIGDFKLAYDATSVSASGALGVIFVMNMTTPGADFYAVAWNRAVDQTPGSADWWAMMNDRYARNLKMLDEAKAAGIPIQYIEFGNELYFGPGAPGVDGAGAAVEPYSAGTVPASSEMVGAFPDVDSPLDADNDPDLGKAYAFVVNDWAPKLLARYPGVRLCAIGSDGGGGARRQGWNTNVVALIDKTKVPAVSYHIYGGVSAGNVTSDEASLGAAIASWRGDWANRKTRAAMPADREFWFTEWNSNQASGSWGHGLFSAASLDTWLSEGRLGLSTFHQFSQGIIAGTGPGLTATGRAFSLFSLASKNSTRARQLVWRDAPKLTGSDVTAVFGWQFDGGSDRKTKYLLVNLSGAEQSINLSALKGIAGATFTRAAAALSTSTTDPGETTGTVSATMTLPARSITVFQSAVSPVVSVLAASYSDVALTSESIASGFGERLATATQTAVALPLPTTLAGTSVTVRDSTGHEQLAPLFYVSPTQINFLIPPNTARGLAEVTMTSGDGSIATGLVTIETVAPGLFTADASGRGFPAGYAQRVRADGSQSIEPVARFDAAQNKFIAVPIELGPESDQVFLVLFGTGIRFRSSLMAVAASIGGSSADVLYAGAQGDFVGLDQINLRLPRALAGRGDAQLSLTVEGKAANIVQVNIK
jgi:uncharacterized protein (TIGR03437 family)